MIESANRGRTSCRKTGGFEHSKKLSDEVRAGRS